MHFFSHTIFLQTTILLGSVMVAVSADMKAVLRQQLKKRENSDTCGNKTQVIFEGDIISFLSDSQKKVFIRGIAVLR